MKRPLLILLAFCMLFAFSSCSINKNGLAQQEKAAIEYVNKYCGKATIVDRNSSLLNTITNFTLCDTTDGFEYHITTTEVYMSDLGFEPEDEPADTKTIFINNYFMDAYLCYLLENRIDGIALLDVINNYSDLGLSVVSRNVVMTTYNNFEETTIETAFIMKEANEEAAAALAKVLKKADTRNLLNQAVIPVYANTESEEVIAFYSFFFGRLYTVEESSGVDALHE